MPRDNVPYVCRCGFCEQGILRLIRCNACEAVVASCDECELTWSDIVEVRRSPKTPSSAAYPACPACRAEQSRWTILDEQAARRAKLLHLCEGGALDENSGGG